MKRAVLWVRQQPHYRRDAIETGLKKLGFTIVERVNDPRPGDALVSWNLYASNEPVAENWRKAGGKVLIAENGYIGKDKNGHQLYALARDGHNGSGTWYVGQADRWSPLKIELKRREYRHGPVIVRAQRGIGTKLMASPPRWARETVAALQKAGYKVEHRLHPGTDVKQERDDPDSAAIDRAGAVAIWSSAFGVKAAIAEVPVYCAAPHWILKEIALPLGYPVTNPFTLSPPMIFDEESRMRALRRLAWAQWTVDEIASGEPFDLLLNQL